MRTSLDQLDALRTELRLRLAAHVEADVSGILVPVLDNVLNEATESLPAETTLRQQVADLITPATVLGNGPVRAVEAMPIVARVMATVEQYNEQFPALFGTDRTSS